MPRAPFIVIEGLDRSGKTTQTSLLRSRLEQSGHHVALLKFPDRTTPIGTLIDSYLRSQSDLDDHAIHLLFSANRWELASRIESNLKSNTIVLCDRYAFSGIAFSAAKGPPPLGYEWCRAPDVGLPCPDVTLFLDITPEKARERGGYGEERYEKEEMQRRVREVFRRLGEETGGGGGSGGTTTRWEVIDAGRDQETVSMEIWRRVENLVANGLEEDVDRLWKDRSFRLIEADLVRMKSTVATFFKNITPGCHPTANRDIELNVGGHTSRFPLFLVPPSPFLSPLPPLSLPTFTSLISKDKYREYITMTHRGLSKTN